MSDMGLDHAEKCEKLQNTDQLMIDQNAPQLWTEGRNTDSVWDNECSRLTM